MVGHQCCFGAEYRKETAWLTNAPWLRVLGERCPGPPDHPPHPALEGRAVAPDGSAVWATALAAEYPEGLCDALARAYAKALATQPRPLVMDRLTITAAGRVGGGEAVSAKAAREQANNEAIGGLRDAYRSVEKVPGWKAAGELVLAAARTVLAEHRGALVAAVRALGKVPAVEVPVAACHELRRGLAVALGLKGVPEVGPGGLQAGLVGALTELAKDPDAHIADWLKGFVPLGIERPILPGGVFPSIPETHIGKERDRQLYLCEPGADIVNYLSYEENVELADAELRRELEAGFLEWSPNREALEDKVGVLRPAKVATIVKTKGDSVKVRLIHDLRRNGTNSLVRFRERLVLPRLCDVTASTLDELEELKAGEVVRFLVLDFADAFKTLHVHPEERKYLAGKAMRGWFVYFTVMFGIGSGPLVWGRVAAWVMRSTQAMLHSAGVRVHCYVDDPFVVLRGTPEQVEEAAALIVLWWATLGLRLAYKKGQFAASVDWIGARIAVDADGRRVEVTVPEAKNREIVELLRTLAHGKGLVPAKALRTIAGKCGWVAGLLPQLRPFVRQVWAAFANMQGRRCAGSKGFVWRKQVKSALDWLLQFHLGQVGDLRRLIHLADRHGTGLVIETDASPWGGGAACWRQPARHTGRGAPDAFIATVWTAADEQLLGARIGDPAHQATWEAYMFLLAVRQFVSDDTRGSIAIVGDALGVWHNLIKMSSSSGDINCIAKELALFLAPLGHELVGIHVWSECNELADQLSRLGDQAGRLPAVLTGSVRERMGPRGRGSWQVLGAKGPPRLPASGPRKIRRGCKRPAAEFS